MHDHDKPEPQDLSEALRKSEERLRLVQSAARIGCFDWDLRTNRIWRSPEYLMLQGLPPDTWAESDYSEVWLDRVHPEERAEIARWAEDVLKHPGEFARQYRIRRADTGEVRWIDSRGRIECDDQGRPVRMLTAHTDITDLKSAQEALQESEERMRLAIAGTGLGAFDMDLGSGSGIWSETAFEMLGLRPSPDGRASISDWLETIHPDDIERVRTTHDAAAERGGPWQLEYRIIRADTGVTRWLEAFGQFLGAPERRRSIGVVLDVTARKCGELRQAFLLRLADRLRDAETARDATEGAARLLADELRVESAGFVELDPERGEGLVLSGYGKTADKFVRQTIPLGAERGPLRGASIADLSAGRTFVVRDLATDPRTAGDAEQIRKAIRAHAVIHAPLTRGGRLTATLYVHSDRPRAWTDDEIDLVEDTAARTADAVERMRAEDALIRVNAALAEEVTAAVSARESALLQLHQAQKLETIGQLTGGIAHDFNNLLTPITGALDILLHRLGDDPRLARLIGGALQSAERARTLVQRLLGFARRQPLTPSAVDLGGLLDGMRDLISSSVGPAIPLVLEIEPELAPAFADANQLELAILNLCVNARDAMPGGGALTIAARGESLGDGNSVGLPGGDYVRLSVIDTGCGMDEETRRRAIEPFFSTKGTERGTGLGLSMVHGLAGQLGGGLAIWSMPGDGTRVDLWLPVARPGTPLPEPASPAPTATVRPLRVLLVDDEQLVRAGTAEMLRDLGHHVIEAGSARDALSQLDDAAAYDVVVTDYMMPDIDGIELARRVRALRPAMPVLLVTGYMGIDDTATDLPRLAKPFGRSELNAYLAKLAGELA
jgi:signal transduction histidine kinase/PAS domain-containing protein